MELLAKDLALAARALRKHPAFALTAIATIGLGIGASASIFSVVNAVLLRPLPYADTQRLVTVWQDMKTRSVTDFPFPAGDFHDLREQGTSFEGLAAVTTGRQPLSGDDAEPELITTAVATPNLFSLLGARVALGRDFVAADGVPLSPAAQAAAPRAPMPAILRHEFWQRRYGGDPMVLGRGFDLGGGRAEVVGVLQPGFELLFPPNTSVQRWPDVWMPMNTDFAAGSRINVSLRVVGRLKPTASMAEAQTQMDALAAELRQRFAIKQTVGYQIRLEPMHEDLVAEVRPAIQALMGAVGFVLLIACANVANLLLVRAAARERELALRAALGGNPWRLVRQLLAESLLLALLGAVLGLWLAWLGTAALLALRPEDVPRLESVAVDPAVVAFALLAAFLAAALFGVVPALRASRPDLVQVLHGAGRSLGLASGRRLRDGVVMAEVALSLVLLIGSGLMLRSFVALVRMDPGYDPSGVLTFYLTNPRARGPEQRAAFVRQLRERLQALPGVRAVTASSPLPLDGGAGSGRWGTEAALADPNLFQQATVYTVLPGYFETLRTPVLEGRTFTEEDNAPEPRRVVIDRRLAAKAFPGESALGKRLLGRIRGAAEPEWYEIIGVVAHQRHTSLASDGRESLYVTDAHMGSGRTARWAVRSDGDPARLAGAVRAEIAQLDPLLAVAELQPMSALVSRAQGATRFALTLIAAFALIAAALAAVGLYGVLSTVVSQRTAEIGVRMAFGAPRASIFRLVVGHGLRLSGVGIASGALAALALSRVMSSMLVGVAPSDPATFVAIPVLFLAIAALASWLPARRAAALDPLAALREE